MVDVKDTVTSAVAFATADGRFDMGTFRAVATLGGCPDVWLIGASVRRGDERYLVAVGDDEFVVSIVDGVVAVG